MIRTACAVPRCPYPAVERGRCRLHRETTGQRGYGRHHQAARRELAVSLPAPCFYCGILIHPGDTWVAAHVVDGDPTSPRVHSHPDCNERAKGGGRPNRCRVAVAR